MMFNASNERFFRCFTIGHDSIDRGQFLNVKKAQNERFV